MRKLLFILGFITIILLVYVVIELNYNESTVTQSEPQVSLQTNTQEINLLNEETEKVRAVVVEDVRNDFSALQMGETFIYGSYAFQVWFDDNLGGEALLKKENDSWVLVSLGGGAWEDYSLVDLGVPPEVASEMIRLRPY